ncbi:MAG: ISL3 family transposase [Clostridia bacterium]|nr:ISL3 family transposase [Clostridia bacterium]
MRSTRYEELTINQFIWGADHFPYAWEEDADKTIIRLKSKPYACACPYCGTLSNARSSTYERLIQDVPYGGKTTYLAVRAYKYKCLNPDCMVKTFNEVLPFAHSLQRRTDKLNELILAVSLYLSAEGASQVLGMVGVRISNDAIQALWSQVEFRDRPEVTEIGVDDVAIRKGHSYATAIYDKRDGAMLALLEGRDGSELRAWLEKHPRVERVARDRASAYAKAISEVLPQCAQTADRYHLFANMSEHLLAHFKNEVPEQIVLEDDEVTDVSPELLKPVYRERKVDVSGLQYDTSPPLDSDGTPVTIDAQRHKSPSKQQTAADAASRQKKKRIIQQVQEFHADGMNFNQISKEMGISHGTVKKYANMQQTEIDALDHPTRKAPRKNRVGEECIPIMYKMMADGHDDITILSYLRAQGYNYALGTLHSRMRAISMNHFPRRKTTVHPGKLMEKKEPDLPDGVRRFSRMEVFYGLLTHDEKKLSQKADLVHALTPVCNRFPAAREIREAAQDFHQMIFGDNAAGLDAFVEKYQNSFLRNFCLGLTQDFQAVSNAVTTDLNSGWVEGSNNKFKLIKRTLYGRASRQHLESKCIAVFASRKESLNLVDAIKYKRYARSWYVEQSALIA